MPRSIGAAASQGIESGLNLGLRLRDQSMREDDLARRNSIQDEDRAYIQGERSRKLERESDDDAMKALEAQQKALLDEGEGLATRYAGQVPTDIGSDFARRQKEVAGARDSLLRKRYEPVVAKRKQAMQDLVSRMTTGQVQVEDVPDGDFYNAIVAATRRDPKDLMSVDGKPSRVSQATTDLMTGIQTGNEGMTLSAANVIAEPELKEGIGQPSPHGGTIVGKEIVKLIPHPQNPDEFLPVVRVYVKKGDGKSDKPGGATSYYDAPITENRSSDPNDPIKSISVKKAMDYAAQLQTLSTTFDRPDLRKKLEKGAAEAAKDPDDFLTAFYALRGKMPAGEIEFKTVPNGGVLVGLNKRTGKEVSRVEGPDAPATGLAGNVDAIQAYADENDMTFDDAAKLFQQRGLTRAPGKGAGGDLTGDALLAKLSPQERTIVKGLADGSVKASDLSMKGDRRERMLALAAQYDPNANAAGKQLPAPVVKQITEARDNAATIKRLTSTFDDSYAGKGILGLGAERQLGMAATIGADKKAVEWWKNYRRQAELVERHALFGASLTTGEQEAWRSADIGPGMSPDVIRQHLATREQLAAKVLDNAKKDLIDAGHSEKRINAIADRDQTLPERPPAKAGGLTKPAAAGGGGAGGTPPASALTEGAVTTFRNGQRWTLRNGQAVQVK